MTLNIDIPDLSEMKPRIVVFGVGGAGGNAVNNMIEAGLEGVDFVVANTDAQALAQSSAERRIQMGTSLTEGLGAGAQPQVGQAAAEEALDEIAEHLTGAHMTFITAGMGGGTGTGASPVIARLAREQGILTVGVVTKPFQFEGARRMEVAEQGIEELQKYVDTLIIIPNQNLFRVANEKTTFADAFAMADQVLHSGVAGITDLMVKEGLINLDFADVRTVMNEMGQAMMGTGEATGERRAIDAAEAAIANPLLDDISMKGANGLLISITGGYDLTLYEVDEAANRIRADVDPNCNIVFGATFDASMEGAMRVSIVATGIKADTTTQTLGQPVKAAKRHTQTTPQAIARSIPQAPLQTAMTRIEGAEGEADIVIRRKTPKQGQRHIDAPRMLTEPAEKQTRYIPPAAEVQEKKAARIPALEDFPPIAQQEYARAKKQQASEKQAVSTEPKRKLFGRFTSNLGRKNTAPKPAEKVAPRFKKPEPEMASPEAASREPHSRLSTRVEALRATLSSKLSSNETEEENLEIPAFLRRHMN